MVLTGLGYDIFGIKIADIPWDWIVLGELLPMMIIASMIWISYRSEGRRGAYRTAITTLSGYLVGRFLLT